MLVIFVCLLDRDQEEHAETYLTFCCGKKHKDIKVEEEGIKAAKLNQNVSHAEVGNCMYCESKLHLSSDCNGCSEVNAVDNELVGSKDTFKPDIQ